MSDGVHQQIGLLPRHLELCLGPEACVLFEGPMLLCCVVTLRLAVSGWNRISDESGEESSPHQ